MTYDLNTVEGVDAFKESLADFCLGNAEIGNGTPEGLLYTYLKANLFEPLREGNGVKEGEALAAVFQVLPGQFPAAVTHFLAAAQGYEWIAEKASLDSILWVDEEDCYFHPSGCSQTRPLIPMVQAMKATGVTTGRLLMTIKPEFKSLVSKPGLRNSYLIPLFSTFSFCGVSISLGYAMSLLNTLAEGREKVKLSEHLTPEGTIDVVINLDHLLREPVEA